MSKLPVRGSIIREDEQIIWIVSSFDETETILESPDFIFADNLCCFRMKPKWSDKPELLWVLHLNNVMPRQYTVAFEVGWKNMDGSVKELGRGFFKEGELRSDMINFRLFELLKQNPSKGLSITLKLKREGTEFPRPPKTTPISTIIAQQMLLSTASSSKERRKRTGLTTTLKKAPMRAVSPPKGPPKTTSGPAIIGEQVPLRTAPSSNEHAKPVTETSSKDQPMLQSTASSPKDSIDSGFPVSDVWSDIALVLLMEALEISPENTRQELWENIVQGSILEKTSEELQKDLKADKRAKEKHEKETTEKTEKDKEELNYLKERKRLVKIAEESNYFTSKEKKSAAIQATAIICHVLSPEELRKVNDELETEGADKEKIFLREVKSVKKRLELEKEKFNDSDAWREAGKQFLQQNLKKLPEHVKEKLWQNIVREYTLGGINQEEKEKGGKNYLKEGDRLVKICQKNNYFAPDKKKSAGIKATAIICHVRSSEELRKLNDELEMEGADMKSIFLREVESIKKHLELEKEKFNALGKMSAEESHKEEAASAVKLSAEDSSKEEDVSVAKMSAEDSHKEEAASAAKMSAEDSHKEEAASAVKMLAEESRKEEATSVEPKRNIEPLVVKEPKRNIEPLVVKAKQPEEDTLNWSSFDGVRLEEDYYVGRRNYDIDYGHNLDSMFKSLPLTIEYDQRKIWSQQKKRKEAVVEQTTVTRPCTTYAAPSCSFR